MKNSFEISKELATQTEKFATLADKDQRSDEDNSEMNVLRSNLHRLNQDLGDAQLVEAQAKRAASANLSDADKKTVAQFSFARSIKEFIRSGGNPDAMTGLEKEMHDEARRELQASGANASLKGLGIPMMVLENSQVRASTGQNVTTSADGGYLIQEDPLMFIASLKNALVLPALGAKFLTNLQGNLPLVNGGAFAASWIAEGSAVSFTKEAFAKRTMTPKNLMVAGAFSKQLLNQSNLNAEMLIREELLAAMALGLQDAAITGAGGGAPTGILATSGIGSVAMGTNGLAIDWASIIALETALALNNAPMNTVGYLVNTKTRGKLKSTLTAAGVASPFIWSNNEINGYKTAVTNAVPSNLVKGSSGAVCSAVICGDWSELFIGLWGGMDVVVDPYSRADYNEVKLVINQFADVALRNVQSFAACKDVLTT